MSDLSQQSLPPGALEALLLPSNTGNRSAIRKLSDFDQGVLAVSTSLDTDQGLSTNKFDLLCPRSGCGSIILKAGVGRWVESVSVEVWSVSDQSISSSPLSDAVSLILRRNLFTQTSQHYLHLLRPHIGGW
jgi:hypothetical protein